MIRSFESKESAQLFADLTEEQRRQVYLWQRSKGDFTLPQGRHGRVTTEAPRSLLLTGLPDRGGSRGGRSLLDLGVAVGMFVLVTSAAFVVHVAIRWLSQPKGEPRDG